MESKNDDNGESGTAVASVGAATVAAAPPPPPPPRGPPQRMGSSMEDGTNESIFSADDDVDIEAVTMMFPTRSSMISKGAARRTSTVRISQSEDIITGRIGGAREQHVEIRSRSISTAGTPRTLARKVWQSSSHLLSSSIHSDNSEKPIGRMQIQTQQSFRNLRSRRKKFEEDLFLDDEEEDGVGDDDHVVFRLEAKKTKKSWTQRVCAYFGISVGSSGIYDDGDSSAADTVRCCGISPNSLVNSYLHYSFRASFIVFVLSACLLFFAFTIIFAVIFWAMGRARPYCIHVNGKDFGDPGGAGEEFADAFALSWTTFSTVGYGLIYPSTSNIHTPQPQCTGVTILCSIESFIGVLFASMCGAILFGKVSRVRSQAQVIFSDPMVIRYGSGVMVGLDGDDDDESSTPSGLDGGHLLSMTNEELNRAVDGGSPNGRVPSPPPPPPFETPPITTPRGGRKKYRNRLIPCPILEFRIVNRLHNSMKGEIIDATLNIIASIDEKQAKAALSANKRRGRRRKGKVRGAVRRGGPQSSLIQARILSPGSQRRLDDSLELLAKEVHEKALHRPQAFDEDPDGFLVARRVFVKLELESPDHPFFRRVWIARHPLNEISPLLTDEAREAVKLNQGFWPEALNNYQAVRDAVQFDQILVSLSGTSNVDANSVYAQKIYHHQDVNVGWRFVNLLFRDELDGGAVRVDSRKVNDVVEQAGGGGEPFQYDEQGPKFELGLLG